MSENKLKESKVKKSSLQRFIEKGGYKVVSYNGTTWRGVAEAVRATGLSKQSVMRILRDYPTEPNKGEAKYVSEFEESQGYQIFRNKYKNKGNFNDMVRMIREAWLLLNKKDPITWNKDDYQIIWESDKFFKKEYVGFSIRDPNFNAVPEAVATAFHNLMKETDRHNLLPMFKGKKYPKGGKIQWYLTDDDIITLTQNYTDNECLLMTLFGVNVGGRWSSLVTLKPSDLDHTEKAAVMYEQKVKHVTYRYIYKPIYELIQRYIKEYNVQPDERLFTQSYDWYLRKMKEAGKNKITKTMGTHILKHTFVTQAHAHGVSAEIIVQQTGTDWGTLTKHYKGGDEAKAKHEIQGEKYDIVAFPDWLNSLMPHFTAAYDRIKRSGVIDGVRGRIRHVGTY